MAHEQTAMEPATDNDELRSRLRRSYEAASWGYAGAREERSERLMLWWGTRVVGIREMLNGDKGAEEISDEAVERLEKELREGPSSKK